jgi:hypothetical protein
MGLARPTGEYAERMLSPDGWPDVDEDANYRRAYQYTQVLAKLTAVLDNCRRRQAEIFDGRVWSGGAAGAASRELGTDIDALTALQDGVGSVISWHEDIVALIIQAKSKISDTVAGAHQQINALKNDSSLKAAERTSAINKVLIAAYGANAGVVAVTAEQILASKAWKPANTALQDLLDRKKPPPVTPPDPVPPGPVVPPPVGPVVPQPSVPRVPKIGPLPIPGTAPFPGWSPVLPAAAAGVPRPAVPGSGPTLARNPAASAPSGGVDDGDEDPAAPVSSGAPSSEGEPQDSSPRVAPASATGMPMMSMAPGATGGGAAASGAGSGEGAVSGLGAPAGRVPRGVRPAAGTSRAGGDPAEMDVIPVSAARAERDAIAEAASADAQRRSGADRLQLARRIAAALNAPVNDQEPLFGFVWVTGLTTDGAIVVANSYGLAYIPEGVRLPEQVYMASADKAIPAAERARWATYPVVAVQRWAAHRDAKLRAVIATAEQLAESDPGAAKVVLAADDIPDSGEMIGRSRLEVVDPKAAERLAQTPDARLLALLPPAPAGANPPADERVRLWLQVMKPMVSSDPRRQAPHLRAFHAYAAHAEKAAANDARAAGDPVARRCAVEDWLYWKHLTGLLDAAVSAASRPIG